MNCGRRGLPLFLLTGEDILRKFDPERVFVCETCREKLRAATRAESTYEVSSALMDLALLSSTIFALLVFLSLSASSLVHASTGTFVFLEGAVVALTGLNTVWDSMKRRYGLTHNLVWSLKSRGAIIGLSLVLAGTTSTIFLELFAL